MLVIYGVVLRVLEEIDEVGNLESNQRFGMRNGLQSCDETLQIINVRKDMPAQDQVCAPPFGFEATSVFSSEKLATCWNSGLDCHFTDVPGWLHAQHFASLLLELLQEQARVTGNFHDARFLSFEAAVQQMIALGREMRVHGFRIGRHIGVAGIKNLR